jgi:hypothetical protein
MKRFMKRGAIGVVIVLLAAQAYRPDKNVAAGPSDRHISRVVSTPPEVEKILRTSCYDCHSNSTRYPWYAEVQPVGWFLNNHIVEGKRGMNFDEYASYRPFRQLRKLEQIRAEVEAGEMPLASYLMIHTGARLSSEQEDALMQWVSAGVDSLRARYPADSLQRPQNNRRPGPESGR